MKLQTITILSLAVAILFGFKAIPAEAHIVTTSNASTTFSLIYSSTTPSLKKGVAPTRTFLYKTFVSKERNDKREERIRDFAIGITDLLSKITDKLYVSADKMEGRIVIIEDAKKVDLSQALDQLDSAKLAINLAHESVDAVMPKVDKILDDKKSKDAFEDVKFELQVAQNNVEFAHKKLAGVVEKVKVDIGLEEGTSTATSTNQ